MEYTATAFAEPLRRVFAELYRPTRTIIDFHPKSKYFVRPSRTAASAALVRALPLHAVPLRLRGAAARVRQVQADRSTVSGVHDDHAPALLVVARWSDDADVMMAAVRDSRALPGAGRGWAGSLAQGRLQTTRRSPWQPYWELRKLFQKEVVVSATRRGSSTWPVRGVRQHAGVAVIVRCWRYRCSWTASATSWRRLSPPARHVLLRWPASTRSALAGWGRAARSRWPRWPSPRWRGDFCARPRAGSTNLGEIARAPWPIRCPRRAGHLLAFAALFIVMLAETGRLPIDNPPPTSS